MIRRVLTLGVLTIGVAMSTAPTTPARACNEVITWSADLKGTSETPPVDTAATGKAAIVFDFDNPRATMTIDNAGLKDVVKIELHACTSYTDLAGPPIATLYTTKDGDLPASYQKVMNEKDIIKSDKPVVATMRDLANVVLNGQAAVIVYTKGHPDGEIAGKIGMHKSYAYSDGTGGFHDPKLHSTHAAAPTPPPPATPSTNDPATPGK